MKPKVTMYKRGTTKNLINRCYIVEYSNKEKYDIKCYKDKESPSTGYKIRAVSSDDADEILETGKAKPEKDSEVVTGLLEKIERWNDKRGFKRESLHSKNPVMVEAGRRAAMTRRRNKAMMEGEEEVVKILPGDESESEKSQPTAMQINENAATGLIKASALIINADGTVDDNELKRFLLMCSQVSYLQDFEYETVSDMLNYMLEYLRDEKRKLEDIDDFMKSIKELLPKNSETMRSLVKVMSWLIKADGDESGKETEMALRIIREVEVPIGEVFLEGLNSFQALNRSEETEETEDSDEENEDASEENAEDIDEEELKILPDSGNAVENGGKEEDRQMPIKITRAQTIKLKIENPKD